MIFLTDKSGKLLTKDGKLIKAPEACERYIGLSVYQKLFTTEGDVRGYNNHVGRTD